MVEIEKTLVIESTFRTRFLASPVLKHSDKGNSMTFLGYRKVPIIGLTILCGFIILLLDLIE